MNAFPEVYLKPFEEKRILRGHPWIYKSEIKLIPDNISDGDIVLVRSGSNKKIGIGYLNRKSEIIIRMLDIAKQNKKYYPPLNIKKFLEKKIITALEKRKKIKNTEAKRLIFSEADRLPGLIVDEYKNCIVVQINTLGIEKIKEDIFKILLDILKPEFIFEKSLSPLREKEGLKPFQGVIYPKDKDLNPFIIKENNILFKIDVITGTKTGFYIDQRENREKLKNYVSGKRVLDCFCYTGGFSCYSLKYGAKEVLGIDSSLPAIKIAEENMRINNFRNYKFICADVFEEIKNLEMAREKFDVIILDPPAFSKTNKEKKGALSGYKKLLLSSLKILNNAGVVFVFSCSNNIDYNDIMFCIKKSVKEIGCNIQIIEKMKQSSDHPIIKQIPETFYLRGLTFKKL
ncbi:MAG: class I SAM-dependent rRNA methyltransferase [Candidatus Goldbacteria bacterium]|nr:class I SAM-dependent rRNA methyltransferase [Candidatus Goldiibacteriota bacterium]